MSRRINKLTALQDDALAKVQCDKVFTDTMTGKRFDRTQLLSERTQAGLEAARACGRKGGSPRATRSLRPGQFDRARQLYAAKQNTVAEIMALTGLRSRATFYT